MGQDDGREWAAAWARRIGANITRLRKEKELSAQKLSDRCAEVGYPIPRSTIANIESGRKRDIPVQEVAVIARALGVAPLRILYHAGEATDILPGVSRAGLEGAEWFSGKWPIFPDPGLGKYGTYEAWREADSDSEPTFLTEEVGELWLYRQYQKHMDHRHDLLQGIAEATAALKDLERGQEPVQAVLQPNNYKHWTQDMWEGLKANHKRVLSELDQEIEKLAALIKRENLPPPPFGWGADSHG